MCTEAVVVVGGSGLLGRTLRRRLNEKGVSTVNIDVGDGSSDYRSDSDLCFYGVDACDESAQFRVLEKLLSLRIEIAGLVSLTAFNAPPGSTQIPPASYDLPNLDIVQWKIELQTNVTAAVISCKVFGSVMAKKGDGAIVLVASDLGVIAPDQRIYKTLGPGVFKSPAYTVGKHALLGLSKHIATFWADAGVRCNAVSPGPIGPIAPVALEDEIKTRIPLGRLATSEEVAATIQFLLSDEASFVTGANYTVDGGRTTW